jgi:hypothetical protein
LACYSIALACYGQALANGQACANGQDEAEKKSKNDFRFPILGKPFNPENFRFGFWQNEIWKFWKVRFSGEF